MFFVYIIYSIFFPLFKKGSHIFFFSPLHYQYPLLQINHFIMIEPLIYSLFLIFFIYLILLLKIKFTFTIYCNRFIFPPPRRFEKIILTNSKFLWPPHFKFIFQLFTLAVPSLLNVFVILFCAKGKIQS